VAFVMEKYPPGYKKWQENKLNQPTELILKPISI
jgi:hypothetical protein